MPTYLYTCGKCDDTFERVVLVVQRNRPQSCSRCGQMANRDLIAEQADTGSGRAKGWATGLESAALGVHPDQVPSERARLKKVTGRDVEFTPMGNPVFHSRGERKAVAKACGMLDLDGGYGDA